jgi:hypothetical protein
MDMQQEPQGTCGMDMQHFPEKDMQHGHVALTYVMDIKDGMKHGHEAWTCSIDMVMKHGHAA